MGSAEGRPPPPSATTLGDGDSCARGPCRLCFENGGELIAPCNCKGSSKWIHRDCLNQWRAAGHNPRALTNCCECGFQYKLQVHRSPAIDESECRRRRVRREIASQGIKAFAGLQLAVISCGAACRACDPQERLVEVWNLPQDDETDPIGFLESLQHHKTTYYLSGLVLFLLLLGISVGVAACFSLGSPGARRYGRRHYGASDCDCGFYDAYVFTRCCGDCGQICCEGCCEGRCCEGHCPHMDIGSPGDCSGEAFAVIFVVVLVILVLIGLFAALVAIVSWVQRSVQRFSQVQEMRLLAREFVVEDLAGPDLSSADLEAAPAPATEEMQTQEQPAVQREVTRELAEILGGSVPWEPPPSLGTSYGSTH